MSLVTRYVERTCVGGKATELYARSFGGTGESSGNDGTGESTGV